MIEGTPRAIVLIHGLWLTSLSWEHWITRYTDRGLTATAPEWPRMDADLVPAGDEKSLIALR